MNPISNSASTNTDADVNADASAGAGKLPDDAVVEAAEILAPHLWYAWSGVEPGEQAEKCWNAGGAVERRWHDPWIKLAAWVLALVEASGGEVSRMKDRLEGKPQW